MAPSPPPSPAEDHHVHSTFSDDAVSTPQENLAAALERGLRVVRMVDHVRATTADVPQRLDALARLPRAAGLRVETGVEAKILDVAGGVDAPADVLCAAGGPGGGSSGGSGGGSGTENDTEVIRVDGRRR